MTKQINLQNPNPGGVFLAPNTVGAIPPGTVLDYVGDTAPTGFLICDGSAYNKTTYPNLWPIIGNKFGGVDPTFNVPDCRDKFIKGKNTDSIGDTGGQDSVANHSHSITSNVSVGNHSSLSLNNHSNLSATIPNHKHQTGIVYPNSPAAGAWGFYGFNSGGTAIAITGATGGAYANAGANYPQHSQNNTGNYYTKTDGGGGSVSFSQNITSHGFSQNITSHSVTNNAVTSSNENAHDNRPAYVTMNKIIKY